MRVGVIQSAYVPWRGYFDFIRSVDLFVVYDDVQYSKGSWRNRNQVKCPEGPRWLTVPVHVSLGQAIDEVMVAEGVRPWRDEHRHLLRAALEPAPYFRDAMDLWEAGVHPTGRSISALNVDLLRRVCDYYGVRTPLEDSRQYRLTGRSTERLLTLLERVGATTYVSGPAAKAYLDERQFRERGIRLEYKSYDYRPYPQLWGEYVPAVTVLDMIANLGPAGVDSLASLVPNEVAVP